MQDINLNKSLKNFCVVGYGKHAEKKIIPALVEGNKVVCGIVTSKKDCLSKFQIFNNIKDAVISVPDDTIFIIATPPDIHFKQAKEILDFGRDLIIEKPAFITVDQLESISLILSYNNSFLLEGFMHRYTNIYKKFFSIWNQNKNNILMLKSSFFIPEIPQGTFRDKSDISLSCLYDMGCYGLSLLNDLGLNLDDINIHKFETKKSRITYIQLKGVIENITIDIDFGSEKHYENFVEIINKDKSTIRFAPFFYGIKSLKTITHSKKNNIRNEHFLDQNGFEIMFDQNRQKIMTNQVSRMESMLLVTKKLEDLSQKIKL